MDVGDQPVRKPVEWVDACIGQWLAQHIEINIYLLEVIERGDDVVLNVGALENPCKIGHKVGVTGQQDIIRAVI
ncbi:MAG: hypothetical protein ACK55I_10380 [bacterium]